jgi:hypothetical protein
MIVRREVTKPAAPKGVKAMKTKDLILGGVIILNLFFAVTLAAVVLSGHSAPATAGHSSALESAALGAANMSTGGYYHICPIKIQRGQDALAVIDTYSNQINFYVAPMGTKAYAKTGPPQNLAVAFGHPK